MPERQPSRRRGAATSCGRASLMACWRSRTRYRGREMKLNKSGTKQQRKLETRFLEAYDFLCEKALCIKSRGQIWYDFAIMTGVNNVL